MKYYLFTFQDNWTNETDEMEFCGNCVIEQQYISNLKEAIRTIWERHLENGEEVRLSMHFSANQINDYDTLDDFLNCAKWEELSADEVKYAKKYSHDHLNLCDQFIDTLIDEAKPF